MSVCNLKERILLAHTLLAFVQGGEGSCAMEMIKPMTCVFTAGNPFVAEEDKAG